VGGLAASGARGALIIRIKPGRCCRQTDVMRNVAAIMAVVPLPETGGGTSLAPREVLASSFDARR